MVLSRGDKVLGFTYMVICKKTREVQYVGSTTYTKRYIGYIDSVEKVWLNDGFCQSLWIGFLCTEGIDTVEKFLDRFLFVPYDTGITNRLTLQLKEQELIDILGLREKFNDRETVSIKLKEAIDSKDSFDKSKLRFFTESEQVARRAKDMNDYDTWFNSYEIKV